MFKKFVSTVVASVMTLTIVATTAFAAVSTDVAGTKYEEAAEVLGVLDIMVGDYETGAFRPEDTIIRSEVTKVAVAALGLTDVASTANGPTKYPDVVENHWANGYINVASNQNLIIGDDVGTFRPDASITYAEAVTILVRALGYEPKALTQGTYPTGHLVVAANIGLTKGVSGSANDPISRGDVARLTFNALTIKLMEQTGFGNDINYEVVDKTLLEDMLNVQKVTGQVIAVGSSTLTGDSKLDQDEIQIGEEIYNTGDADVRQILGFHVAAYVKEDDMTGENVLLLARPEEGKNSVVTVSAENIAEVVNTESAKELHYWDDEENDKKPIKETIALDAKVMYNGKTGTFEDFKKVTSGSIVLLDSNNNGQFNVVFVNETVNYVVEEVSVSGNKVFDKYGQKTLVLDPDDKSLSFHIVRGSEKLTIEDLKEWDVLTVTQSKDGGLVYVEVSNESVTGTVTEIDEEKNRVFINGEDYKIAANYKASIKLEDEGTFYLDVEGKIAAVDNEKTASSNYAYLADIDTAGGLEDALEMKIFDKEGATKILKSASKLKVNGKNNLTPDQALKEIKGIREDAAGQLITLEVNGEGNVYRVDTAASSAAPNEDVFTNNLNEDDMVYKAASRKLVGSKSVNVTDETIVFDIPEGETDTKEFSIRKPDFFTNEDKYNVQIFDLQENMDAKVIIVTNAEGKASEESPIAVVDKITQTRNENGVDIEKLYAYQNGEKVELLTAESGVLVKAAGETTKQLEQGDIIQIKTNAAGEIEDVTVLFDITTKGTEAEIVISEDLQTVYGKVVKKFSGSFNLQVNDGTVHNYTIGDAKIYNIDTTKTNNRVTIADAGDIQKYDEADGSKVFVRIYKDVVQEIVIIK